LRDQGNLAKEVQYAALWQEMVRLNGGLVTIPKVPSTASGGDVVFAHDAVSVAGVYHTMDRTSGTQARLEPSTPELVYTSLRRLAWTSTRLRIPIPPGRHNEGARVLQHFDDPAGR
jgi:hypothetical protein